MTVFTVIKIFRSDTETPVASSTKRDVFHDCIAKRMRLISEAARASSGDRIWRARLQENTFSHRFVLLSHQKTKRKFSKI